jgi:hypothetical protein
LVNLAKLARFFIGFNNSIIDKYHWRISTMPVTQNNTYNNVATLGINWNALLNALPKADRKAFKCSTVAQPMRQATGTPMYRPLNVFNNSVSPTVGHPWTT